MTRLSQPKSHLHIGQPLTYFQLRQRLDRARAYMDGCYSAPLDLNQIARQACFSRFHLSACSDKPIAVPRINISSSGALSRPKYCWPPMNSRSPKFAWRWAFRVWARSANSFINWWASPPLTTAPATWTGRPTRKNIFPTAFYLCLASPIPWPIRTNPTKQFSRSALYALRLSFVYPPLEFIDDP